MQSKTIDLKLNYDIKNCKIIFTLNNETIISSHDQDINEIKLLIYNYDEENSKLFKPTVLPIVPKLKVFGYDIITNKDEIIAYVVFSESLVKYTYNKNDVNPQIGASGDTANQKSFEMNGMCKIPNNDPVSLKISRNGSILCLSFSNGEVYAYNTLHLFEFNKISYVVLDTENNCRVKIKDISPDATAVITRSENQNICILWNIERNKRIIDLFHLKESDIVDCVFGRIEAVSHIYNIYAVYNSNVSKSYWIVTWSCSTFSIKNAVNIYNKLSNSLCTSHEGRYVAVSCFLDRSIDVFTSFNLQKMYTFSCIDPGSNSWFCHFLSLTFSMDKLQHEFDLLCLHTSKDSSSIDWVYEPLRYNYSVIWPISAAIVLIIAIFYFVLHFGL